MVVEQVVTPEEIIIQRVLPVAVLLWLQVSETLPPLQTVTTPSNWGGSEISEHQPKEYNKTFKHNLLRLELINNNNI